MNELGLSEWEPVKFGECVHDWAVGPRFSGDLYDSNGNVATLRTTDMDTDGCIELATMPLARIPLTAFMNHFLQSGDVVISRSGTCGITGVFTGFARPVLPGAFLIRFRLNEKALPAFIRYLFNSPIGREKLTQIAEGGVQKNIRGTSILRLPLELPPVAEQRKIAAILTTVDNLIEQTELLIEKYRRVKAGMMADLLTQGIDHNGQLRPPQPEAPHLYKQSQLGWIPRGWDVKPLHSVAAVKYGISDPLDRQCSEGMQIISLPNVNISGEFVLDDVPKVDRTKVIRENVLCEGDLLFNWRNGSLEHLGKTAYFDLPGEWTHVGFLLKVSADRSVCDPKYLFYEFARRRAAGFFMASKIQVNNTFNSSELREMIIRVPDTLAEQKAISGKLASLDFQLKRDRNYLDNLHVVKSGLMQDLLTGNVRVKVDESSEVTVNG